MQNLDVISVNIWQILISLANLGIIFLIVKRFLFKPVKNVLSKRQAELDERYDEAKRAQELAEENRATYEEKLATADKKADDILLTATENATARSSAIIADAEQRAEGIIRVAKTEAALERKKAEEGVKREIVEVSSHLTKKIIGREVNMSDHKKIIDSVIDKIGEDDE